MRIERFMSDLKTTFDLFLNENIGLYYYLVKLNKRKYFNRFSYNLDEEIQQLVLIGMWLAWKRAKEFADSGEELPCKYSTMVKIYIKYALQMFVKTNPETVLEERDSSLEHGDFDDIDTEDMISKFIDSSYSDDHKHIFKRKFIDRVPTSVIAEEMGSYDAKIAREIDIIKERFQEFFENRT